MLHVHFLEYGTNKSSTINSIARNDENIIRLFYLFSYTTNFNTLLSWLINSNQYDEDEFIICGDGLNINLEYEGNPELLYIKISEFAYKGKHYYAPITRTNMIELVKLWPFMEANNEEVFLVFDGYTYTLYGDADKKYVMQLIRNDLILQLECILLLAIEKKQNQIR